MANTGVFKLWIGVCRKFEELYMKKTVTICLNCNFFMAVKVNLCIKYCMFNAIIFNTKYKKC